MATKRPLILNQTALGRASQLRNRKLESVNQPMDKAYKIYREKGAMSHLVGNESTVLPRSRSLDPGPFFDLALEAKTMAVRCARQCAIWGFGDGSCSSSG